MEKFKLNKLVLLALFVEVFDDIQTFLEKVSFIDNMWNIQIHKTTRSFGLYNILR